MPKILTFLLVALLIATPLVFFLGFHDDCSKQACHMLMTNLFILTSVIIVSVIFLITKLVNEGSLFGALYYEEIFLPPRIAS